MRHPFRTVASAIQLLWMIGAPVASLFVAFPVYADCGEIRCDGVNVDICADPEVLNCCTYDCAVICTSLVRDLITPETCAKCAVIGTAAIAASISPITKAAGVAALKYAKDDCVAVAGQTVRQEFCVGGTQDPTDSECCIYKEQEADADGKGERRRVECKDKTKSYLADCYCRVGDTIVGPKQGQSYQSCTDFCKEKNGEVDNTQGIGLFRPKPGQTAGASGAEQTFVNALCFTAEECASPDYGGSVDAWVKDPVCAGGKGKCRAPEPVLTLSSVVGGQATVQGLRAYVELMFRYLLSIVVLAAAVAFIWGGFKYIIGSSLGDITSAKNTMINAVVGLLLCFGSVTILNTLNPATTRYDALDVWLINKQEFAQFEWCDAYKPAKAEKPVLFADAGDPPGSASFDAATFDKPIDKTICGEQYYPQGFSGNTCKGQVCQENKVCVPCQADIPGCEGRSTGSGCIKAAVAGTLTYQDGVEPKNIYLLAVCEHVQQPAPWTAGKVADGIPKNLGMEFSAHGNKVTFFYPTDPDDAQDLIDGCADKGGLRGVLFGVVYEDTGTEILAGAAGGAGTGLVPSAGTGLLTGGVTGLISSAGTSLFAGGVVGGAAGAVTVNDVLIMGKDNCEGSVEHFDGYANGTAARQDFTDMKTALFCGWNVDPKTHDADPTNATFQKGKPAFWTQAELVAAMSGDGEPIKCNSFLNKNNAPSNPGTSLMGGCNASSVYNP